MPAIHLIIKGKVQGVFFRASTKKKAGQIGITGWVRNTEEGHVEIMAQGTDEQIRQFVEWCEQGPPNAQVEKVVKASTSEQPLREFKILHN